jgi:Contractile injection system tube protein
MSVDKIARAVLSGTDGKDLECQFNPSTVRITKTSHWNAQPTRGSAATPRPQFVGAGPEVLTARLLFDDFDTLGGDSTTVPVAVATLRGWTCVPALSYQMGTPQPPIITFWWGNGIDFTGFLQQVQIEYTMFAPGDGTPLRAIATISLHSVPDDPPGTNPTSGGISGRRSALLEDCDGLAAIAYREYGDPALWRGIAIANGIEDPARIGVGTRLLVPPRTQAAELSQPGGEPDDGS